MPITSLINRWSYTGNGVTDTFAYTNKILAASDLKVYVAGVVRTLTTDYSVTGAGGVSGGNVVFVAGAIPASAAEVVIVRDVPATQAIDFIDGGPFPSADADDAHDKLTILIQQTADRIDRSLRLAESDPAAGLPVLSGALSTFYSKYLGFDVSGNPVPLAAPAGTTTLSTFMATVVVAASAAAARSLLGLVIGTDVAAEGAVLKQGKHTVWVPGAAMRPTVSNGCAPLVAVETTAGRPDMDVLDFGNTADEHAQFQIAMPKSWNLGTLTFQGFWTTAGAVTTGIALAVQAVAMGDSDTMDIAYGTAIVVTDDALGVAEDLMVTAESAALTVAGTPGDDNLVVFRLFRDVSDANDDMTQDMRLIGVKLFYTSDAATDA